jgi:metal-responsive CopG/Arc/MetJ family transcriptional regulator
MSKDTIIIKKRGEDGSKIITVRIKEDILKALDNFAAESNYSRNELINIILRHGINNIEIQ